MTKKLQELLTAADDLESKVIIRAQKATTIIAEYTNTIQSINDLQEEDKKDIAENSDGLALVTPNFFFFFFFFLTHLLHDFYRTQSE